MNIKALLLLFVLIGTFACNQKKEAQASILPQDAQLAINHKEKALVLLKNLNIEGKVSQKWLLDDYTFYVLLENNNTLYMRKYSYDKEFSNLQQLENQALIQFQYYDSDDIIYETGQQFYYQINSDGDLWILQRGSDAEKEIYSTADKLIP